MDSSPFMLNLILLNKGFIFFYSIIENTNVVKFLTSIECLFMVIPISELNTYIDIRR